MSMERYFNREPKEKSLQNSKIEQENSIGLDQKEQAMNGNYGMAQTKEEDGLVEQD